MKKALAIMLCALMMFMSSAMAASQEITIENVMIYSGEQVIMDLSGIELKLGLGQNEEYAGVMAGLNANGENVLEAVAAVGAEDIILSMTGLSDYYSINLQELLEMLDAELAAEGTSLEELMNSFTSGMNAGMAATQDTAALENVMAIIEDITSNNLVDGGTEDIEGVTYQIVTMTVSEEQMDELMKAIMAAMDAYVPQALEGTGYDSFVEAYADAGMYSSAEGAVYVGETDVFADFYQVIGFEGEETEEVIEHYVSFEIIEGETEGDQEIDIWYSLYSDDDDFTEPMFSALFMVYMQDGAFAGVETLFEADGAQLYVDVLSQQTEGGTMWEVSIGDYASEVNFTIGFGPMSATEDCFYVDIAVVEEIISLAYVTEGGAGQFEAYAYVDGEEIGLVADVNTSEGDAAWLPANVTETVDVLSLVGDYMSEANVAQIEKLNNEAVMLLNNVLVSLAESNETIAALLGYAA